MIMKLRKLEIKDAPLMLEWMHDENVIEYMQANFSEKNLADCEEFIKKSWNDNDNIHFAIVDNNNEYQGTVSLKCIDYNKKSAEFAITIRQGAMGTGIASQAMKELITIGKREYGLKKIYWCVSINNKRAIRFYEKNNYRRISPDEEYEMIKKNYSDTQLLNLIWFEA